jgi:CRISPR-associated protein Cmr4
VRSAKGSFAWLTCPLAIQRYARERGVALPSSVASVFPCSEEDCLAGDDVVFKKTAAAGNQPVNAVVLEEYGFTVKGGVPPAVAELLSGILPEDELWKSMPKRLVIVTDGIYSHFCATACEVQQRIQINDQTGVVRDGALFNQENVPSETLFYAVVAERARVRAGADSERKDGIKELAAKLKSVNNILQIGGDETIGLGFCSVVLEGGAA